MSEAARMEADGGELVAINKPGAGAVPLRLPALIEAAGPAAAFVWDEFFTAGIRNPHTRRAYSHAVRRFLAWAESQGHELARLTPGQVGGYLDGLPGTVPTKKLHLAALRGFFDTLVLRHVVILNPALSVTTPATAGDLGRMVKRRMKDTGLPGRLSPHSFRVTAITDLLSQSVPLEEVQPLEAISKPVLIGGFVRVSMEVHH